MSNTAQLHLRDTPSKRLKLQSGQPLTIGSASGNRLALASQQGVSPHHAVVRFTASHGWVVCDWQSSDGTYLEGERVRRCRPLGDGDEIQLGRQGPVLVFSLTAAQEAPAAARPTKAPQPQPLPKPQPPRCIDIDGTAVPLSQIRSAVVLSEPHHPHIFSWWLLTSVAGLLLLPFPLLFWPLELGALAGWVLLGSRKSHTLLVVQHDGQAQRRAFANRVTALAHRNGIRKAIGQSLETP
ncbi:MAG: FHA domain-containing protein [Synechococcaceae bacterium WB8_1B_136]|nr:FHA domain-containing protein [Synechococcaceae bacterium WB8_1B_136]